MPLLTRSDETRRRCDGNKASNSTRAETDSRPFLLETVIPEHPCKTSHTGSQVGHNACLSSTEIGGESRTAIEAKPAKPEEYGAQDDIARVVRFICKTLRSPASALAEVKGDGKASCTRRDMDRCTTSEVVASQHERPAIGIPCPARYCVVDNR